MTTKLAGRCFALSAMIAAFAATAPADEVTDWNTIMFQTLLPSGITPLVTTRVVAMVQASVFDAVNGIESRYTPIHVTQKAPHGASRRAAAVEAAYATLLHFFPAQQALLDEKRSISLAGISRTQEEDDDDQSVAQGIAWGDQVAAAIWDWRSSDGFTPAPPPFTGSTDIGKWRPTPPALAPFAGVQFSYMTPWAIESPGQFRPAGPPALDSAQYAADFNETKTFGSISSSVRTPDETLYSQFWAASTANYYWNNVALTLSAPKHLKLVANARLLAMVNLAMADAAIGCWEAKVHYLFWRPITAIREPTDSTINPDTSPDPNWTPLLATPAHPDYPSGHSCVSGAAGGVLAAFFGDHHSFSLGSDVMTTVTRSYTSISGAVHEVQNARVFAGIHFRTATNDGVALGSNVAGWLRTHSMLPLDQESDDEHADQ